jgi:hypothetical protein
MNLINLIIVLSISFYTLFLLKIDYKKGISVAVFLLILMPRDLVVQLGGGLPSLTGFRGIIIVLIFFSLFIRNFTIKWQKMPILNLLILVLIAQVISLFNALNFAKALDGLLVFFIEILLFYVILLKGIRDEETLNSIIYSMVLATIVIALIGFVERYTQFNPVDYISYSDHSRFDPRNAGAIYSTFSHPIHFGTALAMGWPICLYMWDRETKRVKKKLLFVCLLFILVDLYFSGSRGPWLSFIGATIILILFGFPRIKAKVAVIMILIALVLILRPGIYNSIYGLSSSTFDQYTPEGTSFYYRLELYKKAYSEISKSPGRFAFGYGDGAAHLIDMREEVSYGSGRERDFWSWDSEFALILLQGGFVGLITNLILYFSVLFYLIRGFKAADKKHKSLMVSLIASNSVLIFMMSNVAIFSPQLYFILWTNFAVGVSLSNMDRRDKERRQLAA